jgi:hypothetical protein
LLLFGFVSVVVSTSSIIWPLVFSTWIHTHTHTHTAPTALNSEQSAVSVYINTIKHQSIYGKTEQDVTNLRHTKKPDFIFEMRAERNWIAAALIATFPYKLQLEGNEIKPRLACFKEQKPCTCTQHKGRYSTGLRALEYGTVAPLR